MKPIDWDIRREGRLWSHEEFDQRIYRSFAKTLPTVVLPDPVTPIKTTIIYSASWFRHPRSSHEKIHPA